MLVFEEEWERTSEKCYRKCDRKGGKCSICGELGFCCRNEDHPTWNGNCPIGAIQAARKNGHNCVQPKIAGKLSNNKLLSLVFYDYNK